VAGDVRIETVGFDEIAKRYTSGAAKLRRVLPKEMGTATLMVSRDAKLAAPVDTGLLRSSILPEVQVIGFDVIGIVGSEVNMLGSKRRAPSRWKVGIICNEELR